MDPNANLQEQERRLLPMDRARLRELREALAVWLQRGGFEPDWSACPRAASYYGKAPLTYLTGPYTVVDDPLPWQRAGRQQTASGYGRKLTTTRVVITPDGRRHRVYLTIYSNSGTCWIVLHRQSFVIVRDLDYGAHA